MSMKAVIQLIVRFGGVIFLTLFTSNLLKEVPPMLGGMKPIIVPMWMLAVGFFALICLPSFIKNRILRPMVICLFLSPFIYMHLEILTKLMHINLTPEIKWTLRALSLSLGAVAVTFGLKFIQWALWKVLYAFFWPVRAIRRKVGPVLNRWYYRVRGYPPCPIDVSLETIDAFGNGDTYLKGKYFEEYIANVYKVLGYDAKTTGQLRDQGLLPPSIQARGGSGEQGVDVVVPVFQNGEEKKMIIQCKHYSGKVNNSAIQEIVSAMPLYGGHQAVVITNNFFTKPAEELAASNGVLLIDRTKLKSLIDNAVKKYATDQKAA